MSKPACCRAFEAPVARDPSIGAEPVGGTRTIADLDACDEIDIQHVVEAIQYRPRPLSF